MHKKVTKSRRRFDHSFLHDAMGAVSLVFLLVAGLHLPAFI
ncbi:MAG: hypothetical protein RID15_02170 [Marinovum algicola]|jgi:hypothetical protein|uniref:Uncharacterized protein n=1 Tax=Marinovum algicola TaxID=42444 RepID=A0A975W7G4_9RHOB|nr:MULTISPECIES: hypothetical protein [Marinovum]AKO96533.1 hypothetical protein MALG_01348 [Marinovum algicola DG 898]MDD9739005.1 hypothetical protein [Marinovum sp. SP66]MDD9745885.1 hypothetical protein [Marinovum sp. PR37]SEI83425.1 hypothetical protein SAMN04487940_102154 [Marinovum algicola]SLN15779.1 hypothetical protein MAA5396_00360 [Marinovum algicola]